MKSALRFSGGSCVVSGQTVFNALDSLSHELLTEARKTGEMVIDLAEVSDCDSAFVALVTACLQIKQKQGQTLALTNSPRKLLDMMDVYVRAGSGVQIK